MKPFVRHLLLALLAPVARFAIRHRVGLQSTVELLKVAFVSEAKRELALSGEELNSSRISLLTGVHRGDVNRLSAVNEPELGPGDVIARLIGRWQHKRPFCDSSSHPKPLTYEGVDSEFARLVMSETKEVSPYSVLREMERSSLVSYEGGKLVLRRSEYVPIGDFLESSRILSADVLDLSETIEDNVCFPPEQHVLHLRTEFDNISEEAIEELRKWTLKEGALFQEKVRTKLSRYDIDLNPTLKGENGDTRISVTSFARIQPKRSFDVKRDRKRGRKKLHEK